jgi:uncharacterized protein (DUF2126 family)
MVVCWSIKASAPDPFVEFSKIFQQHITLSYPFCCVFGNRGINSISSLRMDRNIRIESLYELFIWLSFPRSLIKPQMFASNSAKYFNSILFSTIHFFVSSSIMGLRPDHCLQLSKIFQQHINLNYSFSCVFVDRAIISRSLVRIDQNIARAHCFELFILLFPRRSWNEV